METKEQVYKVSGCGISAIGVASESLKWVMVRIIEKGGIPEVVRL
jgi:hypothetical protein